MKATSIKHRFLTRLLLIGGLVFSSLAFSAPLLKVYEVTGVKAGDSLNVRAWPSPKSRVVLALPHNAKWVASSRQPIKKGNVNWQQIHWNGVSGWVNTQYLKYDSVSTKKALQRRNHRLQVQGKSRNVARSAPAARVAKKATVTRNSKVIMECGGNAPFWSVSMDFTGKRMDVDLRDGKPFNTPVYYRKWIKQSNKMVVNGGRGRNAVRATLTKTNACTDGITNIKYPFVIDATIAGNRQVSGCCRSVQR